MPLVLLASLVCFGATACGGSGITGPLPADPDDASDVIDDDTSDGVDDVDDDGSDVPLPSDVDPGALVDTDSPAGDVGTDVGNPNPDAEPGDAVADGDTVGDNSSGDAGPDAAVHGEVDDGPQCDQDSDCPAVPCQNVSCDPTIGECVGEAVLDGLTCDDGNACSVFDVCASGQCVGGQAISCEDDNPCTDDLCSPAVGCDHKNNFAQCDDSDPCTEGDACSAGSCLSGPAKCDDGNPCTADSCAFATGECFNNPDDSLACDDGSDCTLGDSCMAGDCVPGPGPGCDDGNDCTLDACDDDLCKHIALHGDDCDDGDVCTVDDQCALGECESGIFQPCDDLNSCTTDGCTPGVGCDHEPTPGAECDDGDACTTTDVCDGAVCLGSGPLACDDANPCTTDECHPINACVYVIATGSCDDGDACTADDGCSGGACVGALIDCDDADLCTSDSCDTKLGCEHTPFSSGCDDGNNCTDDACDAATGCVSVPNTAVCDDGLVCTSDDVCADGACAGAALDCDDLDQCTVDACDAEIGCVHEPHHGPCDDADACTLGSTCDDGGGCSGGAAVDIDDTIDCTLDSCDAIDGVSHTPDDDQCGLGRVCDAAQGCVMGDVHLLVTKLALLPAVEGPPDDSGQWLALLNVGDGGVDLRGYRLVNAAGEEAPLTAVSGDTGEPLIIESGVKLAGLEAPDGLPSPATDGWDFVFGTAADGFYVDPAGDTLSLVDENGDLADLLEIGSVTLGPTVGTNSFPAVAGASSELDADATNGANDESDNDPVGLWCVWPDASGPPAGEQLSCSRARLNEISLAGADGARFVELHLPGGGPLAGLELRWYDADGAAVGVHALPSGRMPIGAASVVTDGVDGALVPALTDGSVHLHRFGALVDVYGFGTLGAAVDQVDGHPMSDGTPGPAQVDGLSAERIADGIDTDDNSADWQQVDAGSPGEFNAE